MSVTVVTPAIETRFDLLAECIESVKNQTHKPHAHLVSVDYGRIGGARNLNNLIDAATTEWVAPLADDDVLYPNHLQALLDASEGADMVYSWCDVTGRGNWNPNSHFDPKRLRVSPYIPATVLLRKSAWEELGGFPDVVCEDHAFQIKMLDANKKIVCAPIVTWNYRFEVRADHKNISNGWHPKEV